MDPRRLFQELRDRGVLRTAALYGGASFVVLQVAEIVVPALGLPPQVLTWTVLGVLAGFPVAMVLSWIFEVTSRGIVRAREPEAGDGTPDSAVGDRGNVIASGVAAAVAVVAMGASAAYVLAPEDAGEASRPSRVLVTILENRTGDEELDALGYMLADWMTQGLTRTGLVDVVPATAVVLATGGGGLAAETGASIVVSGAYYLAGEALQLQLRVADAGGGRVLAAPPPLTGSLADPLPLVEEAREAVMVALGQVLDPRLASVIPEGTAIPTYAAYRAYGDGLERYARGDWTGGLPRFEEAAREDSTFVQPLLWAALGSWFTGDVRQAYQWVMRAEARPVELLPLERAWVGYLRALVRDDTEELVVLARRGVELGGGDLWEFLLGSALRVTNRLEEAVVVLGRVDPDGPALRGFWQYWIWPFGANHALGRDREALAVAEEAIRRHPDNPVLLSLPSIAQAGMGRTAQALAGAERIRALPGLSAGAYASYRLDLAAELRAHGQEAAGVGLAGTVVEELRRADAAGRLDPGGQLQLGRALLEADRPGEAQAHLEAIRGSAPAPGTYLMGLLGVAAAFAGDTARAREVMGALEPLERQVLTRVPQPAFQAEIAAALGDTAGAVRLLGEALAGGSYHGLWLHANPGLRPLRGVPAYEALVRPRGG